MAEPTVTWALANGQIVTIAQPDLVLLHLDGQIPSRCKAITAELIDRRSKVLLNDAPEPVLDGIDPPTAGAWVRLVLQRCVIDPVLTDDLAEFERLRNEGTKVLHWAQLSAPDVGQLYALATKDFGFAEALFQIFQRPAAAVGTVSSRNDDAREPARSVGDTVEQDMAPMGRDDSGEPVGDLGNEPAPRNRRDRGRVAPAAVDVGASVGAG